jgi:hypothetical protein
MTKRHPDDIVFTIYIPEHKFKKVAEKVIEVLSSPNQFEHLRKNARLKIEKDYDFHKSELPQHLNILDRCSSDQFDLSELIDETASI